MQTLNPVARKQFDVWMTMVLGVGFATVQEIMQLFKRNNVSVVAEEDGRTYLSLFSVVRHIAPTKTEVDLIKVSVAELGFDNPVSREEVCARAKELGLKLCLAEIAPRLRAQYNQQPFGERLIIPIESLMTEQDDIRSYGVSHGDSGMYLSCGTRYHSREYTPETIMVFTR